MSCSERLGRVIRLRRFTLRSVSADVCGDCRRLHNAAVKRWLAGRAWSLRSWTSYWRLVAADHARLSYSPWQLNCWFAVTVSLRFGWPERAGSGPVVWVCLAYDAADLKPMTDVTDNTDLGNFVVWSMSWLIIMWRHQVYDRRVLRIVDKWNKFLRFNSVISGYLLISSRTDDDKEVVNRSISSCTTPVKQISTE